MLLELKTKANKMNGARKYLAIDTEKRTYTRKCPYMVTPGAEIKSSDYKELLEKLEENGFKEVQ